MTTEEVKASLAKAARRAWPDAAKASELPFPEYWKAVTGWLSFHAPHVGDALMGRLVNDFVADAKAAEERGETPTPPNVPDKVRAIWAKAESGKAATTDAAARAEEKKDAWEHAAERAAEVKNRFAPKTDLMQTRLL